MIDGLRADPDALAAMAAAAAAAGTQHRGGRLVDVIEDVARPTREPSDACAAERARCPAAAGPRL